MTIREKLVYLCDTNNGWVDEVPAEEFADYLIENGVTIPAHGKWTEYRKIIIQGPCNRWEQAWKCSECGFDEGFVGYGYCPNCGAIMDLED